MTIDISVGRMNNTKMHNVIMPFTIKDGGINYPLVVAELTGAFGLGSHKKLADFLKGEAEPTQGTTFVVSLGRSGTASYNQVMYYLDLGKGLIEDMLGDIIRQAATKYDISDFVMPLPRNWYPFHKSNGEEIANSMFKALSPYDGIFRIHIVLDESEKTCASFFH